jgi:hypothetical protein
MIKIKDVLLNKKKGYKLEKKEWNNRINILKETIYYHLENIPKKEIFTQNLFYNSKIYKDGYTKIMQNDGIIIYTHPKYSTIKIMK